MKKKLCNSIFKLFPQNFTFFRCQLLTTFLFCRRKIFCIGIFAKSHFSCILFFTINLYNLTISLYIFKSSFRTLSKFHIQQLFICVFFIFPKDFLKFSSQFSLHLHFSTFLYLFITNTFSYVNTNSDVHTYMHYFSTTYTNSNSAKLLTYSHKCYNGILSRTAVSFNRVVQQRVLRTDVIQKCQNNVFFLNFV